jgi:hypothetical protein
MPQAIGVAILAAAGATETAGIAGLGTIATCAVAGISFVVESMSVALKQDELRQADGSSHT